MQRCGDSWKMDRSIFVSQNLIMKFTTTSGPFPVKSFFRISPSSASSLEILRLESKRFNQQLKQVKKMAANTVKKNFILKMRIKTLHSAKSCISEYWKKKGILDKREYLGPVWPADVWSADDIPFCSILVWNAISIGLNLPL